ncbi:MAG: hypothetical protein JWO50_411 [Candidatus Kaiserbacteria bacterium]|nr:hypothetical protein [Candidatus Kaiserbacteria bacterium]
MIERMREHPLIVGSIIAGALLILGAILVQNRASYPAYVSEQAWNPNSPSTNGQISAATNPVPTPQTTPSQAYATQTLPYTTNSTGNNTGSALQGSYTAVTTDNLDALLQSISLPAGTKPKTQTTSSSVGDINVWSYIPSGLVSTSSAPSRSGTQDALYQYGNEIGSMIQGYEATHQSVVQIITGAVNDRQDSAKEAAVEKIGRDMIELGNNIASVDTAPKTIKPSGSALAQSYKTVGTSLIKTAQAQSQRDADYIAALKTYNATTDTFTHAFVGIALVFSLNEVSFSQTDPGSVFTFSGGSGGL